MFPCQVQGWRLKLTNPPHRPRPNHPAGQVHLEGAFLPGIQLPGPGGGSILEEGVIVLEKLLILLRIQTGINQVETSTVFLLILLRFLLTQGLETLEFLDPVGKQNTGLCWEMARCLKEM